MQSAANPGGRQFHYGIREFAMSAVLTGQACHGGLRPLGSTFFVFSDYARPAVRLAALSEAGVMFVYTHDSVGVGEDGPTHEPVEHLMALRAMPNLHVVRPSDANETLDLVEEFLSAKEPEPTAMVLSRQDMPVYSSEDAKSSAARRTTRWLRRARSGERGLHPRRDRVRGRRLSQRRRRIGQGERRDQGRRTPLLALL